MLLSSMTGSILTEIVNTVKLITTIVLALCAGGVTVYAIWIGYKFATAKDESARTNAKGQLIYAIVGLLVVALVATLGATVVPDAKVYTVEETTLMGKAANQVLKTIGDVTGMILNLVTMGLTLIGIWMGWQFMKAEDDTKRKEAKTKLIYLFVGLIAVTVISTIATNVLTQLGAPKTSSKVSTTDPW
jgi:multisubunit Na+/H+ antiporter MnhB subunit